MGKEMNNARKPGFYAQKQYSSSNNNNCYVLGGEDR
jgi:hypothetical protein